MIYPPVDFSAIERILVIKLRHHGDVLLTSPVFSSLKRAIPRASIDALLYKETAPMLEGHPAINQLYFCDPAWKKLSFVKRLSKEIGLIKMIRKNRYDLVINLTEGDRGAIASYLSKADYRVGWDVGKKGFFGKRKIYTHISKKPNTDRHVVELNLDTIRRIGIYPTRDERRLTFVVPEKADKKVTQLLNEKKAPMAGFIHLHPTSRWLFKCLPPKTIAQAVRLMSDEGYTVVVTGAPNDKEIDYLKQIAASNSSFINLGGRLTLKELGSLVSRCSLFVGVDSAPMHMAAALNKAIVALFGPTSEKAWGPWTDQPVEIVSHNPGCRPCGLDGCGGGKVSDCLTMIRPEEILSAIQKVISETPKALHV